MQAEGGIGGLRLKRHLRLRAGTGRDGPTGEGGQARGGGGRAKGSTGINVSRKKRKSQPGNGNGKEVGRKEGKGSFDNSI